MYTVGMANKPFRLPHPNIGAPKELPGFLDAATLRWVQQQIESTVSFWKSKSIAHPRNAHVTAHVIEAKRNSMWWANVAALAEYNQLKTSAMDQDGSDLAG